MRTLLFTPLALLDFSMIQDVADVLQQGGVNVPHSSTEALKTLLSLLLWAILEYSRRRSAARLARNEAHKALDQRNEATTIQAPAAAAGAAGEPVPDLAAVSTAA